MCVCRKKRYAGGARGSGARYRLEIDEWCFPPGGVKRPIGSGVCSAGCTAGSDIATRPVWRPDNCHNWGWSAA